MTEANTLVVSEVFGPTIQGEGPSAGTRAGFIRLGRCNLDCGKGDGATWACDTPYTWDWENYDQGLETSKVAIDDLVEKVRAMDVPLVVITGGEPLLQQRGLQSLLPKLAPHDIEIETNGTRAPTPEVTEHVRFNVSPKLSNSGVDYAKRYKPDALQVLRATDKAIFKFVVVHPDDLDEIEVWTTTIGIPAARVWVMPAGTTADELLHVTNHIADSVVERGWNFTSRLHVLAWGAQRGR